MVNDHRYTLVRTSEWPPERYSDSEDQISESDLLSSDQLDKVKIHQGRFSVPRTVMTASVSMSPVRRWKLLPGRNRYYCDGRIMMAKQMGVFYFTVGLIVVTSGLFFGFDCPFLATRINPVLPVVGGVMFIFVMSTLFRTSFMDPGIIPRADSAEAREIEKQIEIQNGANNPTYRPPPRTKEVTVNKVNVKLKYCFTCKIFRPPRASHCSICDNCVERFDHHCPWVGNCVGKRNYRFFYLFIVSLGFYCMFIFACVITHLALLVYEKNQRFLDAVQESPASLIVAVICFLSVWSILGLAGFHTYLIFSNQTTNEDIKGSFSSRRGIELKNPYSRPGFCGNCLDILCGPFHPSLLRRREMVSPDDVRKNEAALRNLDMEISGVGAATAALAASNPVSPSSGVSSAHPSYGTTDAAASNKPVMWQDMTNNGNLSQALSPTQQMTAQPSSSGQYYPNPPPVNPTPKRARLPPASAPIGGRTLPPLMTQERSVPCSRSSSLPRHPLSSYGGPSGDGHSSSFSSSAATGFRHPDFPLPHRLAYSRQPGELGSQYPAAAHHPPRVNRPTRRMPSFSYETDDDDLDVIYQYSSGNARMSRTNY